jgi:hypothetical protein
MRGLAVLAAGTTTSLDIQIFQQSSCPVVGFFLTSCLGGNLNFTTISLGGESDFSISCLASKKVEFPNS